MVAGRGRQVPGHIATARLEQGNGLISGRRGPEYQSTSGPEGERLGRYGMARHGRREDGLGGEGEGDGGGRGGVVVLVGVYGMWIGRGEGRRERRAVREGRSLEIRLWSDRVEPEPVTQIAGIPEEARTAPAAQMHECTKRSVVNQDPAKPKHLCIPSTASATNIPFRAQALPILAHPVLSWLWSCCVLRHC